MAKLTFNANDYPTVGVEIELGLVDVQTGKLANSIESVLDQLPPEIRPYCKPELMQCCLEINTTVCRTIDDVDRDLRNFLSQVESVTDGLGLGLWWGATHPGSRWKDQLVTPDPRYQGLVNLLQEMARRLVTFGLHVHVGVDSGDKAVMICDRIMQHLPTLLALSSSSPFWEGRDTGLHSHRSKIMEGLPTAGLPTLMRNWSEYVWLVNHLIDTGFINTIREIWWDVRPHHNFGTVEVRVCDMPGSLEDVLGLSAFIQCLVQALSDQIDEGAYQHDCHPMIVRQNKWRACRFGNRAKLVNSYTYEVQSVADLIRNLVDKLRSVSKGLGCEHQLNHVIQMVDRPSWSDRQRTIWNETGDPRKVIQQLVAQARVSRPPVARQSDSA